MPTVIRQEFFEPEPSRGSLRRSNGQRVSAFSIDFVQALHVGLIEQFGDNAADILYRSGYEWGLQDMGRLNQELQKDLSGGNLDLWQMDARYVLDTWWVPMAEGGWGKCGFDFSAVSRGVVHVELQGSVVASALAGSEQPVCHLYAGLFAAACSFFDRAERHAIEIECRGVGNPTCRFVVGTGADVDTAETLRQQGSSATDILQRLR